MNYQRLYDGDNESYKTLTKITGTNYYARIRRIIST